MQICNSQTLTKNINPMKEFLPSFLIEEVNKSWNTADIVGDIYDYDQSKETNNIYTFDTNSHFVNNHLKGKRPGTGKDDSLTIFNSNYDKISNGNCLFDNEMNQVFQRKSFELCQEWTVQYDQNWFGLNLNHIENGEWEEIEDEINGRRSLYNERYMMIINQSKIKFEKDNVIKVSKNSKQRLSKLNSRGHTIKQMKTDSNHENGYWKKLKCWGVKSNGKGVKSNNKSQLTVDNNRRSLTEIHPQFQSQHNVIHFINPCRYWYSSPTFNSNVSLGRCMRTTEYSITNSAFNKVPCEQPLSNIIEQHSNIQSNDERFLAYPMSSKGSYWNLPLTNIQNLLVMSKKKLYAHLTTHKGSIEVQFLLRKIQTKEIDLLWIKLSLYLSDIFIDMYGNYFIRCLVQFCNEYQIFFILCTIKERFTEIACHKYGTHPIQSWIQMITTLQERNFLSQCLISEIHKFSTNAYGSHVIQKFISCTNDDERSDINEALMKLFPMLIANPFGVCVLTKLINNTNHIIKQRVIQIISSNNSLKFIKDPYANYVVQALLNSSDISWCDNIVAVIVDNYLPLSLEKFSSIVVEKCLRYSWEGVVKFILDDILRNDNLGKMLDNKYGNYVLEKLFNRLTQEEKKTVLDEIKAKGVERKLSTILLLILIK